MIAPHVHISGAEVDNADYSYSLANSYSAVYALQIPTSIFFQGTDTLNRKKYR